MELAEFLRFVGSIGSDQQVTVRKATTVDPIGAPDGGEVFLLETTTSLKRSHIGYGKTFEEAVANFHERKDLPER